MQVAGISQHTPLWVRARIGHVTASGVPHVMKKLVRKTTEAKEKEDYRNDLVTERLHGYAENYVSPDLSDIARGIRLEPRAMAAYEVDRGILLDEGGWWLHDRIPMFGASPDYLLPDGKGLLEIKCPRTKNHMKYWKYGWDWPNDKNETNEQYAWQMRAQLSVTGREYVDFLSFDPTLPQKYLRMWTKRFYRNEEQVLIRAMEQEVEHFLCEVEREVSDYIHLPKIVVTEVRETRDGTA